MNIEFDWENPEKVWRVIRDWVRENAPKIIRINGLGYGWEPWLQADLADYMQQNTGATLHRESYVYEGNQRMDLTIWEYSGGSLTNYFEFKCRSANMDAAALSAGLRSDAEKIPGIMLNRKGTRAWVMGFFVDDGKPSGLSSWQYKVVDGIGVVYQTDIKP